MGAFAAGQCSSGFRRKALSPPNGSDDLERISPLQRLAPVQKLDRIEPALPGQRFVDCRARARQPLGEGANRKPELFCPGVDQPG